MQTNIPGIMAGGEIMDKVFKQVATSVGQGCAAAMQTEKFWQSLKRMDIRVPIKIHESFVSLCGSWHSGLN